MSILFQPFIRGWSTAGVLIPGAKLRVYDANTTTLSNLYTAADLATPLMNPVVAESDGLFPTIHTASGKTFDVALLTDGDVVIATADDIPSLGDAANTVSWDFSAGGRLAATGAAGVVSLRAGPPVGDDIGGSLVLEGQGGTRLDTLELDAASISATGALDVAGAATFANTVSVTGNISAANIDKLTATGSAVAGTSNIDITLDPAYTAWRVELHGLIPSATDVLAMRFSYDGTTYKSGASDYGYSGMLLNSTGSDWSNGQFSADASSILFATAVSGATCSVAFNIETPPSGSGHTTVYGDFLTSITSPTRGVFSGYGKGSYGKVAKVRLYWNSAATSTLRAYRVIGRTF